MRLKNCVTSLWRLEKTQEEDHGPLGKDEEETIESIEEILDLPPVLTLNIIKR